MWTDRFEIRRKLGAGSFGTVHDAFDRQYACPVALKVLHRHDAASLLRFKHEFRLLADFVHPNLVTLFELFSERDDWFFTMERVQGSHFLDYVRPRPEPVWISPDDDTVSTPGLEETQSSATPGPGFAGGAPMPRRPALLGDLERLRAPFLQLAQGVRALHAARILHRDLKPSNVLVTPAGRVVLLDFGLAKELLPSRSNAGIQSGELAGSPAYMSPEQWLLKPLTEASDWYSVGVMLFEALTGQRPFSNLNLSSWADEQLKGAPSPSALVEGIPPELDALCRSLMHPEPAARPSSAEIIRLLERMGAPAALRPVPAAGAGAEPLVGRAGELAALEGAFAEVVRSQAPVVVRLHGESGMGKSALLRAFLAPLEERGAAVLLKGRCHEREFVPYKAFDCLVDALGRHLDRLYKAGGRVSSPRGMRELIRLFPVLKSAPGEVLAADAAEAPEPQQIRQRAIRAFKELLAQLAFDRPLVLCVDDLQWGDVDGVRLLAELLEPPGVPPLLLLVSHRDEGAERNPCLVEYQQRLLASSQVATRELRVGPLGREDSERFALACLGSDPEPAPRQAEEIARESEGSPFFIEALALHARERDGAGPQTPGRGGPAPSLRELVRARAERLPEQARRLLEVVAVASRPLGQRLAFEAAALEGAALSSLTLLRAHHLLRVQSGDEAPLELTHDRLRESLLSQLEPAALLGHHRRLADALLASPEPDAEPLARHLHAAGDVRTAARYAFRAAEKAGAALAFGRAAELYGSALQWSGGAADPELPEAQALGLRRAHALVHAGRGAEAAPLFLSLAEGAPREAAQELRRLAAVRYLASGLREEGARVLVPLLGEVGLRYPASSGRALLSAVWLLVRLKLRGNRFEPRAEAELPPGALTRLDMCWSVGKVMSNTDPLLGLPFQLRAVLLALEAGEPVRVARTLGMMGAMTLWQGTPSAMAQGEALLEQVDALARSTGDGMAQSQHRIAQAARDLVRGDWSLALERLDATQRQLSSLAADPWDLHMVRVFANNALLGLGRLGEAHQRAARWYREAGELGDVYGRTAAALCWSATLLPREGAEEARARLHEVLPPTPGKDFHVSHAYAVQLEVNAELYEGKPAEAWSRLEKAWPALERSGLLRAHILRLEMFSLRARAAIALAAQGQDGRERLLASAERDARRLAGELRRDAQPTLRLLRAGISRTRGDAAGALAHLAAAGEGFEAAGMELHSAHVRRRHGALLGGDEGRALRARAEAVIAREGIRDPHRWGSMLLAGEGE